MNPKQKIISDRRVQKALAVAVTARAAFYATKTQLEPLMNPGPFAKAYGAEIHATADVERIVHLAAKMAAISDPLAKKAALERGNQLSALSLLKWKDALLPLVTAAEVVLGEIQEQLTKAEREFFERYDVEHEATGVTRQLDGLRQTMTHFKEVVSSSHPSFEGNEGGCVGTLDWFNSKP